MRFGSENSAAPLAGPDKISSTGDETHCFSIFICRGCPSRTSSSRYTPGGRLSRFVRVIVLTPAASASCSARTLWPLACVIVSIVEGVAWATSSVSVSWASNGLGATCKLATESWPDSKSPSRGPCRCEKARGYFTGCQPQDADWRAPTGFAYAPTGMAREKAAMVRDERPHKGSAS